MGFPNRIQLTEEIVPWSIQELQRKERLFQLREMYAADCDDEAVISGLVQSHLLLRLVETCMDRTKICTESPAPVLTFFVSDLVS
jgi:hypothetical protein